MNVLELISYNEAQTAGLARKLADSFLPGDVVVLSGELGSGKTTFVRALVAARGLDADAVSSPSYTLVNEYKGEPPMFHFDFYRLGDEDELEEIGWDYYLNRNGIVLAEWGEKAIGRLPERYYHMKFSLIDDQSRKIELSLIQ